MSARMRVFRWRAVGPLLVFAVAGGVAWALFAETLARAATEEVGTTLIGAEVRIGDFDIDVGQARVTLRGVTVASPFEPFRNLLEAERLVADLDVLPLLENKVIIDRVAATGMRFGTARDRPGFDTTTAPAERGGRTGAALAVATAWRERLDVPLVRLATGALDVGALDPSRLRAVRAAEDLAARADSSAAAWRAALDGLAVAESVDSVTTMLRRLQGARVTDLALLDQARRTLGQARRTRDRLAALERGVTAGAAALQAGVRGLDEARARDYAFARGLVRLPSLDRSDVAAALFAPVAIERFERARYWAELAREHLPPCLRPSARPGPRRARAAGATVRFPRERDLPGFLLRLAEVSFVLGDSGTERAYAGRLEGLTSAPALYGRPTTFGARAPAVTVGALVDHVRGAPRDTAGATLDGVRIPEIALPGLGARLDPGRGRVSLAFALSGDRVRARWAVRSDSVRWRRDTAAPRSDVDRVVWRALSGVRSLDVSAALSGTVAEPHLAVRSNLDQAVAGALRDALGDEVAAAEARLRQEVDRLVEEQAAPARAKVADVTAGVRARMAEGRARLDQAQRDLEARLRQLAGGLRLP